MTMVDELNALLEATQTKGPYLLVGHSFGGLLLRLFASAKSANVYGLVLVESMHRRQFESWVLHFQRPPPPTPQPL
jgi:pimeloyl-ACP methyl ester carboxylesterase